MSSRPKLKLDWCTHEAAKYAVENWHYSKRMPKSKLAKIGVWESDKFVGVVIYGVGATPEIAKPFGLEPTEVCELVRVALHDHITPVSRILAISLKILKQEMPGLRIVVSFADSAQGHHGGIYQASGWAFIGASFDTYLKINGNVYHRRTLGHMFGTSSLAQLKTIVDPKAEKINTKAKYKYLMPLDDEMRAKIEPLRKPYPKRVRSEDSGTDGTQPSGGGANPTRTL